MKERPILFSAPMVRALLDGSKTQTRRVVKPQPTYSGYTEAQAKAQFNLMVAIGALRSPYGQEGCKDRLWVRETFQKWPDGFAYRADYQDLELADFVHSPWKPSIHMPRAASRITLEVTGVRVERLQDISIEDAKAEGAWGPNESIVGKVMEYFGIDVFAVNPINAYQMLWESINGPGSWAANPWVWVISFSRQGEIK